MFCSGCGKEVIENAKFCANCGIQVREVVRANMEKSNINSTSSIRTIFDSTTETFSNIAGNARELSARAAMQVCDLNGDGKIDAEDYEVAKELAKKNHFNSI